MTMNRKGQIALLLALLLMLLCACTSSNAGPAEPAEEPAQPEEKTEPAQAEEMLLTDMIGREISVAPGSYKRVVCIGAGALRMYSYIGDASLLCGVEDIDNLSLAERPKMFDGVARPYMLAYGETFKTLPSCGVGGPNAQAAEAEKILACEPDIVISEYEDVEKEDALQKQLGVPVITLRSGAKAVFDDAFKDTLKLLGTVFGREERAAEIVAFIDKEAAEISARTAKVADADRKSVYICGLGNWGTTNHLMTAENFVSFQVANVRSAVTGLGAPGIQAIEKEKFEAIGKDMDIMIIDAAAVKNIKPLFAQDNAMFNSSKAWNEGEVYLQMAYNAYYTNYEIVLANTWFIAKTVYPELFADIDMTRKTNEITRVFLGKDLADGIFSAAAGFGGYQKIDTKTFFY